jgi:hypothetical protein
MLRNKAGNLRHIRITFLCGKVKQLPRGFFRLRRLMPNQPGDLIWIRIQKLGRFFDSLSHF